MTMIRQEARKSPDVVRWSSDGLAFFVDDEQAFVEDILPRHNFKATKIQSFQRNLNIHGFTRVAKGTHAMGYRHPYFRRDDNDNSKLVNINRHASKPEATPTTTTKAAARKKVKVRSATPKVNSSQKKRRRQDKDHEESSKTADVPKHRVTVSATLQTALPKRHGAKLYNIFSNNYINPSMTATSSIPFQFHDFW
jgi:hypothetical protein